MTATSKALSTETPAAVTFDTLAAAQELRKTGFEDRQAEAIVTTISTAMSETVATRADLELQGTAIRKDMEAQGAAIRAEIAATRTDLEKQIAATRAEITATRKDMERQGAAIRAEIAALDGRTKAGFEALIARLEADSKLQEQSRASMQDRIIIRLGALMVSMTFLLLAVGPFYIRWVLSMMAA